MKLYNFNMEEELIQQMDNVIVNSNSKYKDRTQFIIIAIQNQIKNENDTNNQNIF